MCWLGQAIELGGSAEEVKDLTGQLTKDEKAAMAQKLQDLSNHIAQLMKGLQSA